MPGSIPFTKKCDAYHRMVELLEDGTIGPDMAPRDAYRADPMYFFVKNMEWSINRIVFFCKKYGMVNSTTNEIVAKLMR